MIVARKTTYTESHRKCHMKYHYKNLDRMKLYYHANKEKLKEKRRERYRTEKESKQMMELEARTLAYHHDEGQGD